MTDDKEEALQSSKAEDTLSATNLEAQGGVEMVELAPKYFLVEQGVLDDCEDGLSLSRRSVLTEKLLPATRPPLARRRPRRARVEFESDASLPV